MAFFSHSLRRLTSSKTCCFNFAWSSTTLFLFNDRESVFILDAEPDFFPDIGGAMVGDKMSFNIQVDEMGCRIIFGQI